MSYKISGTINDSATIYVYNKSPYYLEAYESITPGEYSITVSSGLKDVIASSANGIIGYSDVYSTYDGAITPKIGIRSIQRGFIPLTGSGTSTNVLINEVDPGKSMVFGNGVIGSTTGTEGPGGIIITLLSGTTSIYAYRQVAGVDAVVPYELPNFNAGIYRIQGGLSPVMSSSTMTISIDEVNLNRSVLVSNGYQIPEGDASNNIKMSLLNSTTVRFTTSNTGSQRAGWHVIEFEESIIKSIQTATISLSSVTTNTATISGVNISNSILFHQGFTGPAATTSQNGFTLLSLENTTTVRATRVGGYNVVTCNFAVVEFNDNIINTLQRGVTTLNGTNNQLVTISGVDISKSILITTGSNSSVDGFASLPCAYLNSPTSLTVSMGGTDGYGSIAWQVVEFN